MNKKGLTLTELVVTLVIGAIVMLALVVFFVAQVRFFQSIQDEVAIVREARLLTNHMARTMRFMQLTTANHLPQFISGSSSSELSFYAPGQHIGIAPNDTSMSYQFFYDNTHDYNTLRFANPTGGPRVVIVQYLDALTTSTDFNTDNPFNQGLWVNVPYVKLRPVFTLNGHTLAIETRIRSLGDM